MPSVFATLRVKADKVDAAKKALAELAASVRADEPGNLAYIFHQRKDDPTVFMAYEKYVSDEAFAEHGKNLASKGAALAGLVDGPPEIVITEEI
ncbi:MAG: antibiotic biosynthesis monooxygenase [Proteobacteria bacterium]|nr:antibiotic biosynthesis monooxygenase [Pseudomonadota bacterium]